MYSDKGKAIGEAQRFHGPSMLDLPARNCSTLQQPVSPFSLRVLDLLRFGEQSVPYTKGKVRWVERPFVDAEVRTRVLSSAPYVIPANPSTPKTLASPGAVLRPLGP